MVSNNLDVIDSRDIIEEIERIQSEIDNLNQELEDLEFELDSFDHTDDRDDVDAVKNKIVDISERVAELEEELKPLTDLEEEASSSPDWRYGETLIRDDYFTEYTQQLVDDCYEVPSEFDSGDWPWRHMEMDWEAAADELKSDYFDVDFDGVTYWIRA